VIIFINFNLKKKMSDSESQLIKLDELKNKMQQIKKKIENAKSGLRRAEEANETEKIDKFNKRKLFIYEKYFYFIIEC